MATRTAVVSEVQPAEGRKHLSKHRKVQLPLQNFEEKEQSGEFVPFTPINQALRTTHNQSTDTLSSPKVVNFRIYLTRVECSAITENGIDLSIESGKSADTRKLMFHLAKEYQIDVEVFREMFAIWMISPLLEVQLKPYHRPYECRRGWKVLLNRFVDSSTQYHLDMDEPILMLRRNASLSCDREFELLEENPQCARFLITDAREMILLGRIQFLSLEHVINVAALLFCLQYGNFDEKTHDVAFIRARLDEILPEKACDQITAVTIFGKAINKKTAQEERLLNAWKQYSSIPTELQRERKLLLTLAETSSCYGSAWFKARIEKKTSRVSMRNFGQSFAEINVNVGINDRWLTIVDGESLEPILVQSVEELTWKLEKSKDAEQFPFLILNLSEDEVTSTGYGAEVEENDNETTMFLMVTGNQTILIDALLKTLTGQRLERTISNSSSSSDSSTSSGKHASLIQSKLDLKECSASKNRKICLAKFQNGKCTEVAGSFKSFYSHGQAL